MIPEVIQDISREILTQDNAITSDPMFLVQERDRIYGMDGNYIDDYVWIDDEGDEADGIQSAFLDCEEETNPGSTDLDGWCKTYYIDKWKFVTCCFTRKAADQYIDANRHRLTEPRVYVASAYRNHEWTDLRNWLMEQAQEASTCYKDSD